MNQTPNQKYLALKKKKEFHELLEEEYSLFLCQICFSRVSPTHSHSQKKPGHKGWFALMLCTGCFKANALYFRSYPKRKIQSCYLKFAFQDNQVTPPLAHAPLFIVSENSETHNSQLLQSLAHVYHDTEY